MQNQITTPKQINPSNIPQKVLEKVLPPHADVHTAWKIMRKYRTKLKCINEHGVYAEGFLVDARELHKQLEVKTPFTMWFDRKVKTYNYEENQDFIFASQICEAKTETRGGHNKKDYLLTVETAKEFCQTENTEIGSYARKYFILMEKIAHHLVAWNYQRSQEKKTHPEIQKIAGEMLDMYGGDYVGWIKFCYILINEYHFGKGTTRSCRDAMTTEEHEKFVPILHTFVCIWERSKKIDTLNQFFIPKEVA